MLRFDFSISFGQILTILTIIGFGWSVSRTLSKYMYEHELLMQKYCDDMGIDLSKLPTRSRR